MNEHCRAACSFIVLLFPGLSSAALSTYSSRSTYVTATSASIVESFETTPNRPSSPLPIVTSALTLTSVNGQGMDVRSAPNDGGFSTNGVKWVGMGSTNNANTIMEISLEKPTRTIAFTITDWGDYLSGSLRGFTNAGEGAESILIASTPRPNLNLIFFGLSQSVPFNKFTLTSNTISDGRGIDEIYSNPVIPGDANLDGDVDFEDLLTLAQNYNSTTARTWSTGDFDFDGMVSFPDLLLLAQSYGTGRLVDTSGIGTDLFQFDWQLARSIVPEPATLSTIAVVSYAGLRRGRRRSTGSP